MTESFREAVNRVLREGLSAVDETAPALTAADIEAAIQRVNVVKAMGWMQVSCCLWTDTTGENHCDHEPRVIPPAPRRPWWTRLRWWLRRKREQLGRRLGSWLVGEQLLTRDEWYDQREDDW